ncbi:MULTISPECIES: hypothetical protein [Paenibacillus]|uniref:hypothetical protein n=1 Tax=Paenibacillus TaxID=44249 RepID=UPI000B827842|nr:MULTISPECIES: hypothetical protein [Paenibacillus]PRA02812.1 hypothetical protein CQ043_22305 [Paenibacillus sp. MYb63]PRA45619.1 hypothetical protein CQ061_22265 [Paenibacillus sp. MYb67]
MTLKTMLGVALALSVLISTHSANTATLASTNERQSKGLAHEMERSVPASPSVLLNMKVVPHTTAASQWLLRTGHMPTYQLETTATTRYI